MENVNSEWDNLARLIKMIAGQFGSKCEVVLHDLTKDYNHTIVAIENSHVTGREVGGCGSNLGLGVLSGHVEDGDVYNYITKNRDGTYLRSSTMFLKDGKGATIGSICVNYDISELMRMEDTLRELTLRREEPVKEITNEVFVHNVNELLDHLLSESQKIVKKDIAYMTKEDKIKVVEYLDHMGAFQITKAGDRICEYLHISKFTLYNYLDLSKK